VQVVLRGKKYDVEDVSTVKELQSTVQDQSGISSTKQGRVLFGGRKLKTADSLEDAGVEDGSVINIVPGKSSSSGKSKSSSSSSTAAPAETTGTGNIMESMLKNAGIDPNQMEELMKSMPGGNGEMPSMKESMEMMQGMMKSPLFQEYISDPEKLEQSRQMILNNPMMKGMMAGMPGMEEILNDPTKWRETMIAAAEMYKSMGSDLTKAMEGMGDGFGNDGLAALDELSEGED